MKKLHFIFSLTAICLVSVVAFPQLLPVRLIKSENAIDGRYIVILSEDHIPAGIAAAAVLSQSADLTSVYGGQVRQIYSSAVKGFSVAMAEKQAIAMSRDERVKVIEQDRLMSVTARQSNAPWNLDRVDQRNLPWNGEYNYSQMGAGVHAYILDTGIRVTHQEFGGRAAVAYDVIGDGQNGNDCNGHGTHVAGIVGGNTWGVAKEVNLHAVRVIPCSGTGPLSNVLAGVDWVTINRIDPAVVNISAISPGSSVSLETAIANSTASGIVYTLAAGNSALDACGFTPARAAAALTVGASAQEDQRALYSNNGPCVDLFAPGHQITSAWNSGDNASRTISGSSMAAPMVAGAVALYLSREPAATPAAVIQAIRSAATPNVIDTLDTTSPNLLLYTVLDPVAETITATISGRVLNLSGRGIRGVTLRLEDLTNGTVITARTNFFGIYRFPSVPSGRTYVLTAVPSRPYNIANNERTLSVASDVQDINFFADTFIF